MSRKILIQTSSLSGGESCRYSIQLRRFGKEVIVTGSNDFNMVWVAYSHNS